jgi:hypothetical protein
MKLYRAKIPQIAHDVIATLAADGDIEVLPEMRSEAEQDLVAIMEEFLRQDMALRDRIRDFMAARNLPYGDYGRVRKQICEEANHASGDDIERFLCRQFIENMLLTPNIDEVYSEDQVIHKKIMELLKGHNVDEREIREEAESKVKNVREGTVDYELALQRAVKEEKKRRGLI